ncbi:hypothetical protein XhhCFBP4925_21940, partial [Xanthomonas hortorum pv. hederae]
TRTYLQRVPRWWAGKGPATRPQISQAADPPACAVGWREVVLLAALSCRQCAEAAIRCTQMRRCCHTNKASKTSRACTNAVQPQKRER